MKPIIGIISRPSLSETGKKINIIYKDIVSSVIKSNGIPIGIFNDHIEAYLNICDGFILQGGNDIEDKNLEILKILKEKNIPVLGICLGMQEMAIEQQGYLTDVDNHLNNKFHEIKIDRNSQLYKIIGSSKTLVNSRHKSAIKDTLLKVSSQSDDNVIESIEDNNLKFYIGLQWHPENMYDYDINTRKLFDYFIKMCTH